VAALTLTPEDRRRDAPDRLDVVLADGVAFHPREHRRVLSGTSACGLCGRLDVLRIDSTTPRGQHVASVTAALVRAIPERLRSAQRAFAETGGLHAAGLFDSQGEAIAVREDIGRHNAVDKIVGAMLDAGRLPATSGTLGLSGRVAYEIVQKAARAGIGAIVAIGAPSSLAIDACRAAGITLAGFVRDGRFNVYAGEVV
jgi:FdhD protein